MTLGLELPGLEDVVQDVTDLVGKTTFEAGVLVVLKNGAPVKVVRPGKTYRRGLRLPVLGELRGILFSTATHVVEVESRQVATADEFSIPRVTAQFGVSLEPDGNEANLLEHVGRNSNRIGRRLAAEVRNALDLAVRKAFAYRQHSEIYLQNVTGFLDLDTPLLDGLFRAEQVFWADVEWNPDYVAMAARKSSTTSALDEILQGGRLTEAAQIAALAALPGQQAIEQAELAGRLRLAQAQAEAAGIPVAAIMHPELYMEQQRNIKDILGSLVENPRSANNPHVQSLIRTVVEALAPAPPPVREAGPQPVPAQPGTIPTQPLELDKDGSDQLHHAPELRGVLADLDLEQVVSGSGLASRRGQTAVLLVVDQPGLPEAQQEALATRLLQALGNPPQLYVLPRPPRLETLVVEYLEMRRAELPGKVRTFRADLRAHRLVVEVQADGGQLPAVRRALTDPALMILEPLKRTLALEHVEVLASQAEARDS